MRYVTAAVMLGALVAPGVFGQEPAPPKELQSPVVKGGSGADYLKNIRTKWLDRPEGRHAALLFLQKLPETGDYLGGPVASALKADLVRLLKEDLQTSAWADIV